MSYSSSPQTSSSRSTRRSRSSRPGADIPTTPIYVSGEVRQRWPKLPALTNTSLVRGLFWRLALLGCVLAVCVFLMYPLFRQAQSASGGTRAFMTTFPWLNGLFWTTWASPLVALLAHSSWFDVGNGSPAPAANLLLVFVALSFVLLWLAAGVCRRLARINMSVGQTRTLLLVVGAITFLLALLAIWLPGGISQDVLLSALDGRLVVVYHVNPYLATPTLLAQDPVYRALVPGTPITPQVGPLWIGLSVPLAWLGQGNLGATWLCFRILGLFLHLGNMLLIWLILTKLKPQVRLVGMLCYAWNPAILLLGISEMHMDLVVVFFLLLGIWLLQRRTLLSSWICLVLAALLNPLCLLLLPLFLRLLIREVRMHVSERRVLWWVSLALCSVLVVVLAYAPYWTGLGLAGIGTQLRSAFLPDTAHASLLTAFASLPLKFWPALAWLLMPHNWMILPGLLVLGILLLGVWITDTLELALLFSSWIFLVVLMFWPENLPWAVVLPLTLALVSSSRRTSLLAHLLTLGALLAYYLLTRASLWSGAALLTIGLPALIWGWTLFFLSTWEMTHREDEEISPVQLSRRRGLSRPSWPSRPAAWPSRPGSRRGL